MCHTKSSFHVMLRMHLFLYTFDVYHSLEKIHVDILMYTQKVTVRRHYMCCHLFYGTKKYYLVFGAMKDNEVCFCQQKL